MLLTVFLIVCMDAVAKYLTQHYPVPQVVWARFTFHGLILLLYLGRRCTLLGQSRRLGLQITRGALLLATTVLFFNGLYWLPLAAASAIVLTNPLFTTALSVPLLGEPVGVRRWVGVVVGFIGALIIIRPGSGVMQWAALFPLGAALCYALYQITTRKLAHHDHSLTTLLYSVSVGIPATTLVMPFYWVWPTPLHWGIMACLGALGMVSHFCLIKAMEAAPAAVVSPFSYSNMLWAVLLGLVIFGEFPDGWTLVGAGVLIVSGLYVFHREQMRKGDVTGVALHRRY